MPAVIPTTNRSAIPVSHHHAVLLGVWRMTTGRCVGQCPVIATPAGRGCSPLDEYPTTMMIPIMIPSVTMLEHDGSNRVDLDTKHLPRK